MQSSPREIGAHRLLTAWCAGSGSAVAVAFTFHMNSDAKEIAPLAVFAGVVGLTWAMIFALRGTRD